VDCYAFERTWKVLSSLILGNTGKLNFSSIKLCKKQTKKIMQKMRKFSSNIRFLLLREKTGGDLVLYKLMLLWPLEGIA